MWHLITSWCLSWRRQDVLMTLLASLVMVVGMAVLVDHGLWVLTPLPVGVALLSRTPLMRSPFDLGPADPEPFVRPWERDARRHHAERANRQDGP
jgi:hypothetical protein